MLSVLGISLPYPERQLSGILGGQVRELSGILGGQGLCRGGTSFWCCIGYNPENHISYACSGKPPQLPCLLLKESKISRMFMRTECCSMPCWTQEPSRARSLRKFLSATMQVIHTTETGLSSRACGKMTDGLLSNLPYLVFGLKSSQI